LDAALEAALERAFAASAGVDLRFDDYELFALSKKFFRDGSRGFRVTQTSPAGTATPY